MISLSVSVSVDFSCSLSLSWSVLVTVCLSVSLCVSPGFPISVTPASARPQRSCSAWMRPHLTRTYGWMTSPWSGTPWAGRCRTSRLARKMARGGRHLRSTPQPGSRPPYPPSSLSVGWRRSSWTGTPRVQRGQGWGGRRGLELEGPKEQMQGEEVFNWVLTHRRKDRACSDTRGPLHEKNRDLWRTEEKTSAAGRAGETLLWGH